MHPFLFMAHLKSILAIALFFHSLSSTAQTSNQSSAENRFIKHTITNDFISEGVAVADINNDGKLDIIAGAFWFEAPNWTKHEITEPKHFSPSNGYSNSFLDFCMDVDQDGWMDMIRISLPGEEAVWYENPKNKSAHWKMHLISNSAGNESPTMVDVDGDGRLDLLCNDSQAKEMIWMKSPSKKGDTVWQRFVISKGDLGTNKYTHGLGFIDMNGDGRKDVVITKGWWEMPADPKQPNWQFHEADLGEDCSQIYMLDAKGDGSKDLVSSSSHNYGIWWHEKKKDANGKDVWEHHVIFDKFSETHALALADINGDGYPDLVTGKRYFAHNGGDPGGMDPAVLYWFEFKPGKTPTWIPHFIDDNSGVGLQVLVKDMNKDGLPDILICNKKGLFFFEQKK